MGDEPSITGLCIAQQSVSCRGEWASRRTLVAVGGKHRAVHSHCMCEKGMLPDPTPARGYLMDTLARWLSSAFW